MITVARGPAHLAPLSNQHLSGWNDFVAVFTKDRTHASLHPSRITNHFTDFTNAILNGNPKPTNDEELPEDQRNFSYRLKRRGWKLKKKFALTN